MYEIKENQRELNSDWRYYVTFNNKVVKEQLTYKQAKTFIKMTIYLKKENKRA